MLIEIDPLTLRQLDLQFLTIDDFPQEVAGGAYVIEEVDTQDHSAVIRSFRRTSLDDPAFLVRNLNTGEAIAIALISDGRVNVAVYR